MAVSLFKSNLMQGTVYLCSGAINTLTEKLGVVDVGKHTFSIYPRGQYAKGEPQKIYDLNDYNADISKLNIPNNKNKYPIVLRSLKDRKEVPMFFDTCEQATKWAECLKQCDGSKDASKGEQPQAGETKTVEADKEIDLLDDIKLQQQLSKRVLDVKDEETEETEKLLDELEDIDAANTSERTIYMYYIDKRNPRKTKFDSDELALGLPLYKKDSLIIVCFGGGFCYNDSNVLIMVWHGANTSAFKRGVAAATITFFANRISSNKNNKPFQCVIEDGDYEKDGPFVSNFSIASYNDYSYLDWVSGNVNNKNKTDFNMEFMAGLGFTKDEEESADFKFFHIYKGKIYNKDVVLPPMGFDVIYNHRATLSGHKAYTGMFVLQDSKNDYLYQYYPMSMPDADSPVNLCESLYEPPYVSLDIAKVYEITSLAKFKNIRRIYVYNIVLAMYKIWSSCQQNEEGGKISIPTLIEFILGLSIEEKERGLSVGKVGPQLLEDITTLLMFFSKVNIFKQGGVFVAPDANVRSILFNSNNDGAELWKTCVIPTEQVDYTKTRADIQNTETLEIKEEEKVLDKYAKYFVSNPHVNSFYKNRINNLTDPNLALFEFKIKIARTKQKIDLVRLDEVNVMTALSHDYYSVLIKNELIISRLLKAIKTNKLEPKDLTPELIKETANNVKALKTMDILKELEIEADQVIQIPIDMDFLKSNSVYIIIKTDPQTAKDTIYVWVGSKCPPPLTLFCLRYAEKKRLQGELVNRVDEFNEPTEFLALFGCIKRDERRNTVSNYDYNSYILNFDLRDKSKSIQYNSIRPYDPLELYLLPDFGKMVAERLGMSINEIVESLFPPEFSYPASVSVYEIVDEKGLILTGRSRDGASKMFDGIFHSTSTYLIILNRENILERETIARTFLGLPEVDSESLPLFLIFIWRGSHASSLGTVYCHFAILPEIKKHINDIVKGLGSTNAGANKKRTTLSPEEYRRVPPYLIVNETEHNESLLFRIVFNNRIHVISGPSKRMINKIPSCYIPTIPKGTYLPISVAATVNDTIRIAREAFVLRSERQNVRMFKFTAGLVGHTTKYQEDDPHDEYIIQPSSVLPDCVCCELPTAAFSMLDTRSIFIVTEHGLSRMRVWVGKNSGYNNYNRTGRYISRMVEDVCLRLAKEIGTGAPNIIIEREDAVSQAFEILLGSRSDYTKERDIRLIPADVKQPDPTKLPNETSILESAEWGDLMNGLHIGVPVDKDAEQDISHIPLIPLVPNAPFIPRLLELFHSGNDGIVVHHVFPCSELIFSDIEQSTSSYIVDYGMDVYTIVGGHASPALREATRQIAKQYLKTAKKQDGRGQYEVKKGKKGFLRNIHSQLFQSWTDNRIVPSPDAFAVVNERLVKMGIDAYLEKERARREQQAQLEADEAAYTEQLMETFGPELIRDLLDSEEKIDACLMGEHT